MVKPCLNHDHGQPWFTMMFYHGLPYGCTIPKKPGFNHGIFGSCDLYRNLLWKSQHFTV